MPLGGGGLKYIVPSLPPPSDSVVVIAQQLFSPHEKNDRLFLNRYADSSLSEKKDLSIHIKFVLIMHVTFAK